MITASVLIGESISIAVFAKNFPVLFSSLEVNNLSIDRMYTTLKGIGVEDITFVVPAQENIKDELAYKIGSRAISLRDKERLDSLCHALQIPIVRYIDLKVLIEDKMQDQSVLIVGNSGVDSTIYLKFKGQMKIISVLGGMKEVLGDILVKYGKLEVNSITSLYKGRNSTAYIEDNINETFSSRIKLLWDAQELALTSSLKFEEPTVAEVAVAIEPIERGDAKPGPLQRLKSFFPKRAEKPAIEKPVVPKPEVKKAVKTTPAPLIEKKVEEVVTTAPMAVEKPKSMFFKKKVREDQLYIEDEIEDLPVVSEQLVPFEKNKPNKWKDESEDEEEVEKVTSVEREKSRNNFEHTLKYMSLVFITFLCLVLSTIIGKSEDTDPDANYLTTSASYISQRNIDIKSGSPWLGNVKILQSLRPESISVTYNSDTLQSVVELDSSFTKESLITYLGTINGKILGLEESEATSKTKKFTILIGKA